MLFVMVPQSDEFQRFWSCYPKKVGKKKALEAWKRLNPTPALLEEMLAALVWQTQQPQWTKDDGAFIPHASTWLNGERWTDEPPARLRSWNVSAGSDNGQCPRCGTTGGLCRDMKVCNANWLAREKAKARA